MNKKSIAVILLTLMLSNVALAKTVDPLAPCKGFWLKCFISKINPCPRGCKIIFGINKPKK